MLFEFRLLRGNCILEVYIVSSTSTSVLDSRCGSSGLRPFFSNFVRLALVVF